MVRSEERETGVGGFAGMKKEGTEAAVEIRATMRVMLGMSEALVARKGSISWPRAPPNGFAREAIAVAETRPAGVNQMLEYCGGAARTNGWANPMIIWPSIVRGKFGGDVRVPA